MNDKKSKYFLFGPRPFLRWTGGKSRSLNDLLAWTPREVKGVYWESFLGGGTMFFCLAGHKVIDRAIISDSNKTLITTYQVVRNKLKKLFDVLKGWSDNEEFYYKLRDEMKNEIDPVFVAARMIALNRMAFNGLWRVNSLGDMNAPYGYGVNGTKLIPGKPHKILDEDLLTNAHTALQIAEIYHSDFSIASEAKEGDFCYFDPPYIPVKQNSFKAYSRTNFNTEEQIRLRDMARGLKLRNVGILLSNSFCGTVVELYDGFEIYKISLMRSVGATAESRKKTAFEVMIR